ncbi:MAG: glycosyltransferase family 39 protein, partial [Planctomycetota bacterium]
MTDENTSPSGSTAGRGWIWTIFALALLIRGGTLVELSRVDPYWSTPVVDELTNQQDAIRIASGKRQERPFWKPPLYPHLSALTLLPDPPSPSALYSERAPSPWIPKGLQAILDSFTAVLLILLGTRLAGPRTGRIAGLIYAVSFTPVYYCAQLLDTTVFVFACVAMLWTLDRAREKDDLIGWILGGIGIGLATATRAPALLFLPVAMLLPWLSRRLQIEFQLKRF